LTETLWESLRSLAKVRGIEAPLADSELIVHAKWPDAGTARIDAEAEAAVAAVQQWCAAIREARASYQVVPRARIGVRIQATGALATLLQRGQVLLAHMAGAESVAIGADQQPTKDSATVVIGEGKAYLLGVVDLDKERDKLGKQADKLRQQIQSMEQKLGNEGFRAKAPPQVIAQQEESLAAMRQQVAGIEQRLREL
jgi:valyl-tRNA synthetase